MACGDSFLMPAPGGTQTSHLWVFVTEREPVTHQAVIVSVTTLREGKDQTLILRKGEHPFLTHESVVAYRHARIVDCRVLDGNLAAGTIQGHETCSAKLLKDIQDGIFASQHTPNKVVSYCKIALGK
jgi:hypothetical protein